MYSLRYTMHTTFDYSVPRPVVFGFLLEGRQDWWFFVTRWNLPIYPPKYNRLYLLQGRKIVAYKGISVVAIFSDFANHLFFPCLTSGIMEFFTHTFKTTKL